MSAKPSTSEITDGPTDSAKSYLFHNTNTGILELLTIVGFSKTLSNSDRATPNLT